VNASALGLGRGVTVLRISIDASDPHLSESYVRSPLPIRGMRKTGPSSSHAQEVFYVYITQQAYHDEKVNPTPTHEGRTIVYQEMFSVHSQY
jgi:hypothetical protein